MHCHGKEGFFLVGVGGGGGARSYQTPSLLIKKKEKKRNKKGDGESPELALLLYGFNILHGSLPPRAPSLPRILSCV